MYICCFINKSENCYLNLVSETTIKGELTDLFLCMTLRELDALSSFPLMIPLEAALLKKKVLHIYNTTNRWMLLCYITILLHSNVLRMIRSTLLLNRLIIYALILAVLKICKKFGKFIAFWMTWLRTVLRRKERFATVETDGQRHLRGPEKCGIMSR